MEEKGDNTKKILCYPLFYGEISISFIVTEIEEESCLQLQ